MKKIVDWMLYDTERATLVRCDEGGGRKRHYMLGENGNWFLYSWANDKDGFRYDEYISPMTEVEACEALSDNVGLVLEYFHHLIRLA